MGHPLYAETMACVHTYIKKIEKYFFFPMHVLVRYTYLLAALRFPHKW